MPTTAITTIERLEELAAWHRANADHAGSPWIWEARLLTAEDLERQAAVLRARLSGRSGELQQAATGRKRFSKGD
jgi:hypothetical protein